MSLEEMPEIKQAGGFTSFKLTIGLEEGVDSRVAKSIVEKVKYYCGLYELLGAVLHYKKHIADLHSAESLAHLNLKKGYEVKIILQGNHADSKKLALKIYSALTSSNFVTLDFDRYEEGKS